MIGFCQQPDREDAFPPHHGRPRQIDFLRYRSEGVLHAAVISNAESPLSRVGVPIAALKPLRAGEALPWRLVA